MRIKLNKSRTFLFYRLVIMAFSMSLVEAGEIKAPSLSTNGQEMLTDLILENDGEQVIIPIEEWIVVASAYDRNNRVSGVYMGMTIDAVRVQEKGESWERELPFDEIGSIRLGQIKSTKDYVLAGIKTGGIAAAAFGVGLPLIFGAPIESETFLAMGFFSIVAGIYTIPGGALIGFIRGNMAQKDVVEYVIGDGNWTIVQ